VKERIHWLFHKRKGQLLALNRALLPQLQNAVKKLKPEKVDPIIENFGLISYLILKTVSYNKMKAAL
jgi:hypothetical protein